MNTETRRAVSRSQESQRDRASAEPTPPPLAVIGAGRVGQAIARSAHEADLDVLLAGREDSVDAAAKARTALLCVPDSELARACVQISSAVPPLELVGHTSGALSLEVLEPARARGAELFSLHPLQTIPDADSSLAGAPCAIAGSSTAAEEAAHELALRLGMTPFEVPEQARAAYHAAASISSNLLVALEETATELLQRAGIEKGRELLTPIVLRTAANWAERGGAALTGPIARGDEETVERHREAIDAIAPELIDAYEALAARARLIAERTEASS